MSIGKVLVFLVVAGLLTAGVLQYMGIYDFTGKPKVPTTPEKADPYDAAEKDFMAFQYDKAVVEYKKAVEEQPNSDKLHEGMYRIGVCYDNLKGKELEAQDAFKEFVAK